MKTGTRMKLEGKNASSMSEIGLCSEHFHAQVRWYVHEQFLSISGLNANACPCHMACFLPRQDGGCERGSHDFSLFALFAWFGLVVIFGLYLVVVR